MKARADAAELRARTAEAEAGAAKQDLAAENQAHQATRSRLAQRDTDVLALKGELATARDTIARQLGYLDRVLEDDRLREGDSRQTVESMARVPVRVGPSAAEGPSGVFDSFGYHVERRQPPAWFNR